MPEKAINLESMLRVGTILHGSYRIDRYLSSGGFGNTYVATHIDFDETYAVKEFFMKGVTQRDGNNTSVSVSNREKVEEFKGQLEKFKKEARRLRRLNNPHIVRVHDLFEENGTAYYVMDYVDGENLKDRLKRTGRPMTESEVRLIIPQILDALKTVHDAGIWHLDLKPANIMLEKGGMIKLIDFGASKQYNVQKGGATTGTAISYTPGYAPREQMEQSYEKFGPWTDFYALGGTLYNLLTNQRPPMPTDIDDDRSEDKHLALPLPSTISEKMKALILWMMKTNRNERPDSVLMIREFLDKETGQSPVQKQELSIPEGEETVIEKPRKPESLLKGIPLQELTEKPGGKGNEDGTLEIERDDDIKDVKKVIYIALFLAFILFGCFLGISFIREDSVEENNRVIDKEITINQGKCYYTGDVNKQGIPNGQGYAKFIDGRYYEGPFVDGTMEGENAYFKYENGDIFQGSFLLDQFYKGKYTIHATGEYFEGSFSNGSPLSGKWYDKNGELLETLNQYKE